MALIICPECSKSFSDTAISCPTCGYRSGKYSGKSKGLAILLAIFLGGIGIHRFYLGHTTAGVLYLLFFWTLIPLILSLIDAIGLILKPKSEFGDFRSVAKRNSLEQKFVQRADEKHMPKELQ
jgi:hypothetical protein